ncbi:MAG: glycosyltransferase family 4 protein [Solidesulfovibrio sp. DCME]|uniref:glycosyltransferase family 4 protein n=1 Tax=Solidesulfovibrio sp. DCME TaxID=3447380 RepID=UPI003D0F1EDB
MISTYARCLRYFAGRGSEMPAASRDFVPTRPLRVLRLTPYFFFEQPPNGHWDLRVEPVGGMQVQVTEQTRALAERGIGQLLLALGHPGVPRDLEILPGARLITVRLPHPAPRSESKGMVGLLANWALGSLLWALRANLQGKARQFDVVHCHCSELVWTFLAAPLVARLLDLPLVLTVHCSALFTAHPGTWIEALGHPIAQRAERRALAAADRVLVLTPRMARNYVEHRLVHTDRIEVVPDCVNPATFTRPVSDEIAAWREKAGVPPGRRILAYVGRVAPEKGWIILVNAVARMDASDLHVVVCGDGHQLNDFKRKVRERGLSGRFTFTGFVPRRVVRLVLGAAAAMVLPSLHEELGGTLLEAIAVGTPVVASAVGGIPDVVTDGVEGLLVPPGDPEALARALARVLAQPWNMRAALDPAFSSEAVAERLDRVYGAVCAMNAARRCVSLAAAPNVSSPGER